MCKDCPRCGAPYVDNDGDDGWACGSDIREQSVACKWFCMRIEQLQSKLLERERALAGALAIQALWMPVDEEYENEAEALALLTMRDHFQVLLEQNDARWPPGLNRQEEPA